MIFRPNDLNEINVNRIFKSSLATVYTKKPLHCVLFQKDKGFPQDSRAITFDGDVIEEGKPVIEFVLGQLQAVHLKETIININNVKRAYLADWTDNKNLIIALLHLALAAELISPVDAKTGNAVFSKELFPTLSLDDPNYLEWENKNIATLKKMYNDRT